MPHCSRNLTANEKLKSNGGKNSRMLHSPFLCFLVFLNGQLLTLISAPICPLMQIALEFHWVFFLLLSHLQISTDCHSYSISLANYEFKFTFFGLLSQAEESGFSTPKLEGIQREISQL